MLENLHAPENPTPSFGPAHSKDTDPILRAYLFLVLAILMWAGNWVAGRGFEGVEPPLGINFWRWFVAVAVLAPFGIPALRRNWAQVRPHIGSLVVLGVVGGALFHSLVYLGLQRTTAINATLINTTIPVFTMLLAWIVLGERVRPLQVFGVFLSILGVLVIVSRGALSALMTMSFNPGDLIVLAAMPIWAVYTILVRRAPKGLNLARIDTLFVISLAALAAQLPAYLLETAYFRPVSFAWSSLAVFVYMGIFASVLAYGLWNAGVSAVGANQAVFTVPLLPAFATVFAIVLLGEEPRLYHLAAAALILGGVYLSAIHRHLFKPR
ncbi:MAG: DMT family transporter [Alphaproteobacteria bacterium]